MYRFTFLAGTVLLLAVSGGSTRGADAPAFKVKSTLDIAYVPNALERQKLDVFRPDGEKKRPVVLMVHGGSWMIGDKDFYGLYRDVAEGLAKQGLVVVATNYRLTPWVKHPEHARDVARAFAWTRKHAAEHGGDPDNIFLLGHSAGGHLVALLATDEGLLRDKELGLGDADRKALRGVVAFSGVYNVPPADEFNKLVPGMVSELTRGTRVPAAAADVVRRAAALFNPFALVFGKDPKACKQASPLHHVQPGLPPFLLLYAERELPLLSQMAREFGDALKKANNDVEVVCMKRRDHNSLFFHADSADDPAAQAVVKFVQRRR